MNIMGVISKFNENLKPILPPCNHDKLTDRLGSLSDGPKRCSLRISTPDIIANYLTHLKALSAPLMYRAYARGPILNNGGPSLPPYSRLTDIQTGL